MQLIAADIDIAVGCDRDIVEARDVLADEVAMPEFAAAKIESEQPGWQGLVDIVALGLEKPGAHSPQYAPIVIDGHADSRVCTLVADACEIGMLSISIEHVNVAAAHAAEEQPAGLAVQGNALRHQIKLRDRRQLGAVADRGNACGELLDESLEFGQLS